MKPVHECLLLRHCTSLADQELSGFPHVQAVAKMRRQHRTGEVPVTNCVPNSTAAEDLDLLRREVGDAATVSPGVR